MLNAGHFWSHTMVIILTFVESYRIKVTYNPIRFWKLFFCNFYHHHRVYIIITTYDIKIYDRLVWIVDATEFTVLRGKVTREKLL